MKRARVSAAVGPWFSPSRWPPYDKIIAVAAVALAVSVFTPWYKAAIKTPNPGVTGTLTLPTGTVSGIGVHQYLWAAFALALVQFGLIAARYSQPRRVVRVPGYRRLLLVVAGLSFIAVAVGCLMKPASWFGNIVLGDGFSIEIEWDFGALVALGAALLALGVAVAAIRDRE